MFLSIFDLLWSCGDFGSMIRLVIDEPSERRAPKERREGGREAGPDADLLPDRERMPRRGEGREGESESGLLLRPPSWRDF